jgi:hypothetical protein
MAGLWEEDRCPHLRRPSPGGLGPPRPKARHFRRSGLQPDDLRRPQAGPVTSMGEACVMRPVISAGAPRAAAAAGKDPAGRRRCQAQLGRSGSHKVLRQMIETPAARRARWEIRPLVVIPAAARSRSLSRRSLPATCPVVAWIPAPSGLTMIGATHSIHGRPRRRAIDAQ